MTYPLPAAEEQLRFLHKIQRLFDEGSFVSTYKFALLNAIADLSVENGGESGDPLELSSRNIAEKFIELYWRQVIPFPVMGRKNNVLFQNAGRQAAIINKISENHAQVRGNLATLKRQSRVYRSLVTDVAGTVRIMPLWKLQRIGNIVDDFLYENLGRGTTITLRPGVAYCFRLFHSQIQNMVQGAWLRWIRREQRNQSLLGQATDLGDFLFGNDRSVLASYVPLLTELQNGRCFYCGRNLNQRGEVDHFIPWSRYPVDLGHNFVLAHKNCNGSKGNLLSATPHLENWKERNELCGSEMSAYCDEHGLVSDLDTSYSIACWSYAQAENTGAHLWFDKQRLDIAGNDWKRVLTPCSTPCFGP